jgi:hypothetical protein
MMTRRSFAMFSLATLGPAASAALGAQTQPASDEPLRSEFLLDFVLDAQPPSSLAIPGGDRLIVGIVGGTFQGPKLKGTVTGPGGDWIVRRPDGSNLLDVRALFLTDDGEKIYVSWRGISYTDGGTLHARILPLFETGAERYRWLNNVVSVGVYRPTSGKVAFRVFRIL